MSDSNPERYNEYLKAIGKLTPEEQNKYFIPILKSKLKQINNKNFQLTREEIEFLKMGKLTLEQQKQNFEKILEEKIRHMEYRKSSRAVAKKLKTHKELYSASKFFYDIHWKFNGIFHTLPDFLVFAVGRAGTTSLFEGIMEHPDTYRPSTREIYFFDYKYNHGLGWYKGHFPSSFKKWVITKIKKRKFVTGETHGRILLYPHAPKRVKQNNPNVKLIALLRNPIDRAYSLYRVQVSNGRENLSFWDATQAEQKRLDGLMDKMEKDENFYSGEFFRKSYLYQSIYYEGLRNWMRYFPKEQFLILNLDDLNSKPQETFKQIFEFLGLSPDEVKFIHYNSKKSPEIDPDIRKKLVAYFKPYNEKLYKLLGRKFDWDR